MGRSKRVFYNDINLVMLLRLHMQMEEDKVAYEWPEELEGLPLGAIAEQIRCEQELKHIQQQMHRLRSHDACFSGRAILLPRMYPRDGR